MSSAEKVYHWCNIRGFGHDAAMEAKQRMHEREREEEFEDLFEALKGLR